MKKYEFEVTETGFEKHAGEFETIFFRTTDKELALKKYEEEKRKVLCEENFFYKDREFTECVLESESGIKMPIYSCEVEEDSGNYYELYVAVCEVEESEEFFYKLCNKETDSIILKSNKNCYLAISDLITKWQGLTELDKKKYLGEFDFIMSNLKQQDYQIEEIFTTIIDM